jgi:hypothetical protein
VIPVSQAAKPRIVYVERAKGITEEVRFSKLLLVDQLKVGSIHYCFCDRVTRIAESVPRLQSVPLEFSSSSVAASVSAARLI